MAKGQDVSLDEVLQQIVDRDERDRTREIAPLVVPENAIEVDTSGNGPDEVIRQLEATAREKLGLS